MFQISYQSSQVFLCTRSYHHTLLPLSDQYPKMLTLSFASSLLAICQLGLHLTWMHCVSESAAFYCLNFQNCSFYLVTHTVCLNHLMLALLLVDFFVIRPYFFCSLLIDPYKKYCILFQLPCMPVLSIYLS